MNVLNMWRGVLCNEHTIDQAVNRPWVQTPTLEQLEQSGRLALALQAQAIQLKHDTEQSISTT